MRLENGDGATMENLLRVARALGVLDPLVAALDPYSTDVGRLRSEEALPERVRRLGQDHDREQRYRSLCRGRREEHPGRPMYPHFRRGSKSASFIYDNDTSQPRGLSVGSALPLVTGTLRRRRPSAVRRFC